MADNYLENRYEEVFGQGSAKSHTKHINSIDSLIAKNRSYRGYKKDYIVRPEMMERIVAVNTKIPSGRNQQVLRFKIVTKETGAEKCRESSEKHSSRRCFTRIAFAVRWY